MVASFSVLNYEDYRLLLHDWFWDAKKYNPKLSFRYISRNLGLTSPNHFHLVITQRRHLSPAVLEKVLRLMKLETRDRQYVKLLFRECMAKTPAEREKLLAQRQLMKSSRTNSTYSDEQLQIVGNRVAWYIKMGAIVFDGKTRPEIMKIVGESCSFPVAENEIDQALDILVAARQLEFVDGISRFEGGSILTKWDFDSAEVKRHHSSNLRLAIDSLAWPVDQRFHTGVTISCNDELYQSIIADIRSLCLSILERSNQQSIAPSDISKVVTLQMALFPFFKF
jgi:uncharacterized protein (TIGR02147 family)